MATLVVHPENEAQLIWNTNTPIRLVCSCGPFHYPLMVLVSNRNKYVIDCVYVAKIKLKWVAKLMVNKDTIGYDRYGPSVKYGVLMITLRNKFYSTILDSLKMHLKKVN